MELPSPLSLPTTGRVTLDEAREWLYVSLRAGERQAEGLKKLCAALDERKPGEEWLDAVQVRRRPRAGAVLAGEQQRREAPWITQIGDLQTLRTRSEAPQLPSAPDREGGSGALGAPVRVPWPARSERLG
jgi:hypothetical protein